MVNKLAIFGFAAVGCSALAHDNGTPIPGQMVVITQPGVTVEALRAAHPGLSLTPIRAFTPARIHLFQVPAGEEARYELELANDTARVRVAEQNTTVASPEEGTTQSLFLRSARASYPSQPAFQLINGPAASAVMTAGSVVAVLDTGIAPHPDLVDRIAPGGYNFVEDSAVTDESGCEPGSGLVGHGTYVAGLIALTDPDAQLLPIAVLDCDGVGNAFAVACGIYLAIDRGATVINMSFATTTSSNAVERAVEDAELADIICVSSASNGALDTGEDRVFPAEFDQVTGVGGVTQVGGAWRRAEFSDWGRSLDIAAPAVEIHSMWYDGRTFGYARGSGNSFAAAFVSGVASKLTSKYGPRGRVWVESRLCGTATTVNIGRPYGMGCGHREDGIAPIINAAAAVCPADFNADLFVDFFDYAAYVGAFEAGDAAADMNRDAFIDFFDYDAYLAVFEAGC